MIATAIGILLGFLGLATPLVAPAFAANYWINVLWVVLGLTYTAIDAFAFWKITQKDKRSPCTKSSIYRFSTQLFIFGSILTIIILCIAKPFLDYYGSYRSPPIAFLAVTLKTAGLVSLLMYLKFLVARIPAPKRVKYAEFLILIGSCGLIILAISSVVFSIALLSSEDYRADPNSTAVFYSTAFLLISTLLIWVTQIALICYLFSLAGVLKSTIRAAKRNSRR